MWERRVPLCPHHVEALVHAGNKVLIQPSSKRIFSDKQYKRVGAIVTEDLKEASLIIGVKQIPEEKIFPGKNYLFFSHTMKAQPNNMPLLDDILQKRARLFDYENITAGGSDGTPRLVAFGKYAGIAGMIDCLQGLGQKLLADGYSNPFLNIPVAYMYQDLARAKEAIASVGSVIAESGFPKTISPVVFAFTGAGNVTKGSREIFELLPHVYVTPEELKTLEEDVRNGKRSRNVVYGVLTSAFDMVKKANGQPLTDKTDYYANPAGYVPCFHETIIPYTTVLVNGFYWDARYPRLLTNKQIASIRKGGNKNLRMVADITCDPHGSVEFMSHCTPIERPFFSYNPERDDESESINANGICVLGVEILPSELPRDASEHFGNALMPLIQPLLSSKGSVVQEDMSDLPPEMRRACVASHGKLMPKWQYIQRLREQAAVVQKTGAFSASVVLTGHLFDSGIINKVLDHLDASGLQYSVTNMNVKQNRSSAAIPTRLELSLTGDMETISDVTDALEEIVTSVPAVKGKVTLQGSLKSVADVTVKTQKRVLLLGAGMVAQPVIDVLGAMDDVHLTVASDNEAQAMKMISKVKDHEFKMRFEHFTYPDDMPKMSKAIQDSDVVISLMPATMHIPFAKEAIKHKRHMVTASYVSPEMAALHEEAQKAGVILLNGE
jgi:alpha-aminoadipic semialdehyde synthase